jgi:hypothetical protein
LQKQYLIMEANKKPYNNPEGFHKKKGVGRPKGVPNKLSRTVKETVLDVFNQLQDDPRKNLLEFGKKYPLHFYQIAAKLIPTEIMGTSTQVIKVLSAEFDSQDTIQESGIKRALTEYMGDEAEYEPID